MAVRFKTGHPAGLLQAFNARIEQDEPKGKITTWEWVKHNNKDYYTHKAADWKKKAYFTPVLENEALRFNIVKPSDANIDDLVYAYYHGHLTETFLNHFREKFVEAISTAMPTPADIVIKTEK